MSKVILPECKKHPKYKAVHKPRSGCMDCWTRYLAKREVIRADRENSTSLAYEFKEDMYW